MVHTACSNAPGLCMLYAIIQHIDHFHQPSAVCVRACQHFKHNATPVCSAGVPADSRGAAVWPVAAAEEGWPYQEDTGVLRGVLYCVVCCIAVDCFSLWCFVSGHICADGLMPTCRCSGTATDRENGNDGGEMDTCKDFAACIVLRATLPEEARCQSLSGPLWQVDATSRLRNTVCCLYGL